MPDQNKEQILNIGRDFHSSPGGRFYTDGPGSGEEFRELHLVPIVKSLQDGEKLHLVLDDADTYGSSFLSEGFAAAVKYGELPKDKLLASLSFEYADPDFEFYENRILTFIQNAEFGSQKYTPTADGPAEIT